MKPAEDELPQLCARCQDVFIGLKQQMIEYPHTKEWDTLKNSALNGCRLCIILFEHLKDKVHSEVINLRTSWIHFVANRIAFAWDRDGQPVRTSEQPIFAIAPYKEPIGAEDHEVQVSTASPANQRLAVDWVQRCTKEHTLCGRNRGAGYPTRLLEFNLNTTSTQVRLIETGPETPTGPYIALSYCWGQKQPLTLRDETYGNLTKGFAASLLPLTFYHAAIVARWFGVRYLWIDALCIKQDSLDDWTQEAKTMRQVYQNCLLVIAATASSNTLEGCFRTRNPALVPALKINHQWTLRHERAAPTLFFKPSIWRIGIDSSPLAQRAWTVQERFLAPRVLHFGAEQLFWECHGGVCCETFPMAAFSSPQQGFPRIGICGSDSDEGSHGAMKDSSYISRCRLVKTYASGYLTKSSDKLLAFAGIAAQMMAANGGDKYIAGLWSNGFTRWLLWCIKGCKQANGTPSTRPSVYRAPSWSWLSVDGLVETSIITIDGWLLVDLLDVRVELEDKSYPVGDIKNAVAVLRGVLMKASWEMKEETHDQYRILVDGTDRGQIQFDVTPKAEDQTSDVFFVPMEPPIFNTDASEVRGLLLEHVNSNNGAFQRLGIASVSTTKTDYPFFLKRRRADMEDEWKDLPRQDITLVRVE